MNHIGVKEMETERLILRKITKNDTIAAFDNWCSDDLVTEYLRWSSHENVETTKNIISFFVDAYAKPNFYLWAIVPKDINVPIGTISVVKMNEELNCVHIGYCVGSKWWNKGFTTEAFKAIIPFLFEEVKVNRIESQHDPRNPNSGRVMQKCGLKYEGTLREADVTNKGLSDVCMYSLLSSEYFVK